METNLPKFATNSNFLISKSLLQPDGVNLWYLLTTRSNRIPRLKYLRSTT